MLSLTKGPSMWSTRLVMASSDQAFSAGGAACSEDRAAVSRQLEPEPLVGPLLLLA